MLPNLQYLFLRKNNIRHLEHLHILKMLEELDVSENKIECIAIKKQCPKLRILNISKNPL